MSCHTKKLMSLALLVMLAFGVAQEETPLSVVHSLSENGKQYFITTEVCICGFAFPTFTTKSTDVLSTPLSARILGMSEYNTQNKYTLYSCANNGEEIELKYGWYYKIDSANEDENKLHIHVYNDEKQYAQSDDGAPFDLENTVNGLPPKWVMKKVKEQSGWDYKQLDTNFFDIKNISIESSIDGTRYVFPDRKNIYVEYKETNNPAITYQYLREIYKSESDSASLPEEKMLVPLIYI